MNVPDPLWFIERAGRVAILLALLACTAVVGEALKRSMRPANRSASSPESRTTRPLHEPAATEDKIEKPRGVVDLEFARSDQDARRIMRLWGERGRMRAAYNVGLDALFIVLYVAAFVVAARVVADHFTAAGWTAFATAGVLCGWAGVLAGGLDVFENWALLRMLDGRTGWPHVTSAVARVKFWLSLPAGLYLAVSLLVLLIRSLFPGGKT